MHLHPCCTMSMDSTKAPYEHLGTFSIKTLDQRAGGGLDLGCTAGRGKHPSRPLQLCGNKKSSSRAQECSRSHCTMASVPLVSDWPEVQTPRTRDSCCSEHPKGQPKTCMPPCSVLWALEGFFVAILTSLATCHLHL